MARLYISEFDSIVQDRRGVLTGVAAMPPVRVQAVTFTTATLSSPFAGHTKFIRLVADADCHIAFGGGAANVSSQYHPANCPEYVGVKGGDRLSVYDGTS